LGWHLELLQARGRAERANILLDKDAPLVAPG